MIFSRVDLPEPFTPMMPMLLSENIPAYADGATGYFDTVEVALAISMLKLIANGRSDVELIAVLRSPVVGLSAEELAKIRIQSPNVPYADAVKQYAEMEDSIAERLRSFFAQLESWRLRSGAIGLGELLRAVLDESGFYIYAGALPGGAQRQANLDQFVNSACGFDREISGSLTRFLEYTEHLRQKGILVRHFAKPRLNDFNRITIGTLEQMQSVVQALWQEVQA